MSYPSIISQPGSAARNLEPITNALKPLLTSSPGHTDRKRRVLELASFPFEHITAFARTWPDIEWWGSCRDSRELDAVHRRLTEAKAWPDNLAPPRIVDVANDAHWDELESDVGTLTSPRATFEGVIMLNLVHCCPEGVPEQIFRRLSPKTQRGPSLLDPEHGWVAAYGAYKNDDGTYKSAGDQEFERTHIKVDDDSLGLRTIRSITEMAERWGFVEESRQELPKGNMFVVWRVGKGAP